MIKRHNLMEKCLTVIIVRSGQKLKLKIRVQIGKIEDVLTPANKGKLNDELDTAEI